MSMIPLSLLRRSSSSLSIVVLVGGPAARTPAPQNGARN
nr:hypothetical protein JVH1_0908 [Rhodococcus sp. JVH1]